MSAKQVNKVARQVLMMTAILFILLLTSINIEYYLTTKKVLGIETNTDPKISSKQTKFWNKFLTENPDYIPGWIEVGRFDKVREIDPNYQLESSK
jgi:hypothetical protein